MFDSAVVLELTMMLQFIEEKHPKVFQEATMAMDRWKLDTAFEKLKKK